MTEHTEADREALRRWARANGHDDAQAEAVATDPEAHRAAVARWLTARGLDPAQAADPAMPRDPAILADWGPTHGIQANTAAVLASTRPSFPARHMIARPAPGGPVGRRPGVYSLATLEVWRVAQIAASQVAEVDPAQFGEEERINVKTFCERTGRDRSTVSKAVNNPRWKREDAKPKAPARGADKLFNARELADFLNALPRRAGKPPKSSS